MFGKIPPRPAQPIDETDRAGWSVLDHEKKIELWAKHEDVAMHFNDLAMRLRLQALAGVGAATLLAGSISTQQGQLNMRLLGVFSIAIGFVWIGIWLLDQFYYQRLLKGAVARLVLLETWTPGVRLSTSIERYVGTAGKHARWAFYALILAILFGGGLALATTGGRFSVPAASAPAAPGTATSPNH